MAACVVNRERLKQPRSVMIFVLLEQFQVDTVAHVHVA